MARAQAQTLIPKLGSSWPLPNSDRSILSTSQRQTSIAINSVALVLACLPPGRTITLELKLLNGSMRALRVIVKSPLCVSTAKWLLRRPLGLARRPQIMNIVIFHHEHKPVLRPSSALRIITDMALAQDHSLAL